ncbi:MAG: virulence RhuM family protein [Flavobacteriales bacterium]|nr:virulence RhuM family protein [Flavobacteriales bacterium]
MSANQSNMIIYNTADGKTSVSLYAKDGMVWMTQNQLAELFDTSKQNISLHVNNILENKELAGISVVKEYLTTADDGKEYATLHYSLEMIIAIGFKVKGLRGTQFRIWANNHLKEYLLKGFVMDDERLRNPDGRPDYFDEFLARIRDIRASEKRFYQKIRDLFALCSDYDSSDKATQMFFAETQNKLLFAVTHQTAAEIIGDRADASKENMGLSSWKGSIVRKQDITIAKNYLIEDEVDTLNRLVTIFLETAELRVKDRMDITMRFWRENVDKVLRFNDKAVLTGAGLISNPSMKQAVAKTYLDFDQRRKTFAAEQADLKELEELEAIEKALQNRK